MYLRFSNCSSTEGYDATTGDVASAYHVEAAIALCHAATDDGGETDWPRIVSLYDQLVALRDSPVIRLNRAIAVAMASTPAAGIAELTRLEDHPQLAAHAALPATLGALWLRAGEPGRAAGYYRRALRLPAAEPQRRFLQRRLAECIAAALALSVEPGLGLPGAVRFCQGSNVWSIHVGGGELGDLR